MGKKNLEGVLLLVDEAYYKLYDADGKLLFFGDYVGYEWMCSCKQATTETRFSYASSGLNKIQHCEQFIVKL